MELKTIIGQRYGIACGLLGLLLGMTAPMAARAADDIINVVDQAKFKLEPHGLRVGSFLFSPGIAVSETYDDNVYRDETNTKSDFITVVNPSFSAVSDFDLHALFMSVGGSLGYYNDNDNENFEDFNFSAGGRLDLDYGTDLTLSSSFRKDHEGRDSVDDPNADEPVEYWLTTHKASFKRALGIIKLYLEGIYTNFAFDDSQRGNVKIDNSSRDRDIYSMGARLSYEYFPGYNVYVGVTQDWRRYDATASSARDSEGTTLQLGTDLAITGKIRADIYAGYLIRQYNGNFKDVDALNYGGSLIWNVTGLTSLTASVARGVEETTFGDSSGSLQTMLGLGMDHQLRHNLFLSVNGKIKFSDYESSATPRDDTSYNIGTGIEYMPSNGTSIRLGYDYSTRDSSVAGSDFEDNRITLRFSKRL